MNIYTQRFWATCPANGNSVDYLLTIETERMIMVEDIQAAAMNLKGYHEEFADKFLKEFGGQQTLVAYHHGTTIKTVRP